LNTRNGQGDRAPSARGQRVGQLVGEIRDLLEEIVESDVDTFCPGEPVSGDEVGRRLVELTQQLRSIFAIEEQTSWGIGLPGVCDRLLRELDELHDLTAEYHRLGSTWSDVESRFCRFVAGLRATGLIGELLAMHGTFGTGADHGS
jgi:hypothetical protein